METFINILFLVVGMALLIKGADFFVGGASNVAKYLKVPTLVIGLTIVALGTSLPELAVSFIASIEKNADLSVGNIVGSNIFNLLVVLGLTSLFVPIMIDKKVLKFEIPFLIVVSAFLLIIAMTGPRQITWYYGLIFLVLCVGYVAFLIFRSKKEAKKNKEEHVEENKPEWSVLKSLVFLLMGLGMIVFGGQLVNKSSQIIAENFGMDDKLIGLTIVAIGTSLPELVTSLVAAKKGENDIALGNVIGSNTLNILFILGVSSVITPLPISSEMVFDIIVMIATTLVFTLMAFITFKGKGISKICGLIMLVIYVLYVIYLIGRNYGFLPEWMMFKF